MIICIIIIIIIIFLENDLVGKLVVEQKLCSLRYSRTAALWLALQQPLLFF